MDQATKRTTFKCSGCRKVHEYPLYAVAQLGMGHELIFNGCECGKTTALTPRKYRAMRKKMREEAT